MIPTASATFPLTFAAVLSLLVLAVPAAPAQDVPPVAEEVLCPIFIPEAPAKYCIRITDQGCVVVTVGTFGVPGNPGVVSRACGLP